MSSARPVPGWYPPLILAVLGAIWGGGATVAKYTAVNGLPPPGVTFWQMAIAATVLLVVTTLRGRRPPFDRRALRYYAMVGIVGLAVPNMNMVFVTRYIPGGTMAVALTLAPLFTYSIAFAVGHERFDRLRIAGLALGLGGAALLVVPHGSLPDHAVLPYALAAFITPLLYATGNVFADRHRPPATDSVALACGMLYVAALGAGTVAVATGGFHPIWADASLPNIVLAIYGAVSALAFLGFFELLRLAGAVYFSQVAYLITICGVVFAAIVFGERPGPWFAAAVALVFGGVALLNIGRRRAMARAAAAKAG
ncbi:MAG: DMT family transporter [Alphaproteobacteria bacterium]